MLVKVFWSPLPGSYLHLILKSFIMRKGCERCCSKGQTRHKISTVLDIPSARYSILAPFSTLVLDSWLATLLFFTLSSVLFPDRHILTHSSSNNSLVSGLNLQTVTFYLTLHGFTAKFAAIPSTASLVRFSK